MAIEHFDEGVYASNLWFADAGYHYPDAHLYAPPLVPWLIEWALALFGSSGWACMIVSLVTGIATVPLLWWVGRRWFGVEAGLAAASLAAFSDVHLVYSRTALTDVPVGFWLVLAVFLSWEALQRGSFVWGALAGLATGLAWATKYTGWLPLAVGLSGWTAAAVTVALLQKTHARRIGSAKTAPNSPGRQPSHLEPLDGQLMPRPFTRGLAVWAVQAGVAFLVWLPVLRGLQAYGGYAAVAANHKQYLVGLAGWWTSLVRQWAAHEHLSGWLSAAGFGVAAGLAVGFRVAGSTWNAQARENGTPHSTRKSGWLPLALLKTGSAVVLVAAVSIWISFGLALAVSAAAGLLVVLLSTAGSGRGRGVKEEGAEGEATPWADNPWRTTLAADRWLAGWLLAAWWGGLTVAVPFYRPYPRLSLPWLLASWLAAGAAASWLACRLQDAASRTRVSSQVGQPATMIGVVCVSVLLLAAAAPLLNQRGVAGWEDRQQYRRLAKQIIERARRFRRRPIAAGAVGDSAVEFVFYVYAEPALFFHLSVQNVVAQPVSDLDFASPSEQSLPVPVYLIAGPHALRSRQFVKQFSRYRKRFQLVARFAYRPSKLVLLNNYDARELAGPREEEVRLYWLRPSDSSGSLSEK